MNEYKGKDYLNPENEIPVATFALLVLHSADSLSIHTNSTSLSPSARCQYWKQLLKIISRLTTETFPLCIELHSVNFIGIVDKRKGLKKCAVTVSGKHLKLFLPVLGSAIKMLSILQGFGAWSQSFSSS
jgi:hypothetical protein